MSVFDELINLGTYAQNSGLVQREFKTKEPAPTASRPIANLTPIPAARHRILATAP
ncbi:hypothetical protein [Bradyrhizobium pachyrhizi]|uniref:hypothetical protein n=1 Tax=Bradyrhizobium pachyrhizi TaxID=280333 RepID=UPI0012E35F54|nr:hypothetical protein [Bradyrhizobium pachyrhizi]